MASDKIRIQDPASDFYIHLKSESFLGRNKAYIDSFNGKKIGDVYADNANYIRLRYLESRKYLDDLEGNLKYREEMNAVLDLYTTSNSSNTNSILANYVQKQSDAIVEKIKKVQNRALGVGKMVENNTSLTKSQLKDLKDYIKQLNDLLKDMKKYDTTAIGYAADAKKVNRQTIRKRAEIVGNDGLYLMSANKTGQTSLQNLARKIQVMQDFVKSIPNEGGSIDAKVQYKDAASGKIRTRQFSDIFGGIPTQLTNIQGGIGEMMAFVVAEEGIKNGLLDVLKRDNPDIKLSMNTSGSDQIRNDLLGLAATSVSDTKIAITFDENGAECTMYLGISSKAIFTDPRAREKKSKRTSFGTTTVAGLLARARLWEKDFEYAFLNFMAPHKGPNGETVDLYDKSINLRRYLAAHAMRHMLGGLEGVQKDLEGGQKDTVYFLKYQDAMYPVEDYFYGLMDAAYNNKTVAIANVTNRGGLNNNIVTPTKGETVADAAYRRSKEIRTKILKLTATVTRSM